MQRRGMPMSRQNSLFCAMIWGLIALASAAPAYAQINEKEEATAGVPRPRTIYVPFSDLNSALDSGDSKVVIPQSEYRRLLEALKSGESDGKVPSAIISSAAYQIDVENDLARIKAVFKVDSFRESWADVPLQLGTASVGGIVSKPEGVILSGQGDGKYLLILPKKGSYEITLDLATKVHQSPESKKIEVECPPTGQTTVQVTVPGTEQKISLQPEGVRQPVDDPSEDKTRFAARLGAVSRFTIHWQPAKSQMPAMDLLASIDNQTLVNVADGLIHTESWLKYDVLRGELSEARVAIPKSARLLDVLTDRTHRGWTTAEEGDQQIVTVNLNPPVRGPLLLTIRTEGKLPEGEFTLFGGGGASPVAGVRTLDTVRESGQVAIRHSADLSVQVLQQQGLVRIENSEAGTKLTGNNALLYKFYSPQTSLRVTVRPLEPRINVVQNSTVTLQEQDLTLSSQFRFDIQQAGIFELVFQLPPDVIVDQVQCPEMKEYTVDSAAKTLTLSLRQKTLGALQVDLHGHQPLSEESTAELRLPIVEPRSVDRESGTITMVVQDALEVQAIPEGVEAAQPLPVSPSAVGAGLNAAAAWSYSRRPVTIPVRVIRKPTRLSATVGTLVHIDPEQANLKSTVVYSIGYAPVDTFRLEVPEAFSRGLQIELAPGYSSSAPIKQKVASAPENGKVIWTIQTQRRVVGTQAFLLTCDVPLTEGDDASGGEKSLNVEFIRPLGLVNAQGEVSTPLVDFRGEVSFTRDRTLALSTTAAGNGIEQIDLRELTLLPQDGTLAYRYFRDDVSNPVSVQARAGRFDLQDVLATVVTRGLIEIVTSEDESATYRCRFLIRSSERQRLLLALPKDLEVLGVFVNNREVKLEKADVPLPKDLDPSLAPFWVNIVRTESSETPFLLTIQFLWNLQAGAHASLLEESLLHLPLPVAAVGPKGGVQELKVVIWVPEETALVGDPFPFLLQKKRRSCSFLLGTPADHHVASLDQWITDGQTSGASFGELPTQGREAFQYSTIGSASSITARMWNRTWMTILISVTLAVIGWILSGTSWENKLGVLLLMGFAATLYGLYDSHGLALGIHAARFGIVFMLGLWIVRGLFHSRRPSPSWTPREYNPTDISYAVIPPPGVFDHLKSDPGSAPST
jgi:hypothetical protein